MTKAQKLSKQHAYLYPDSDDEETISSMDVAQKKTKLMNFRTFVKNKFHSKPVADEAERKAKRRSTHKVRYQLPTDVKKYDRESSEESEPEPMPVAHNPRRALRDRYLVGRVPLPPGGKPGQGGGVALYVRKEIQHVQSQQSTSSSQSKKRKSSLKKGKKSY